MTPPPTQLPTANPLLRTPPTGLPLAEYTARRERVLKELSKDKARPSAAVVFAGDGGGHLVGTWRPELNFLYLTGIESEPGAAIIFDPTHPHPKRRITLFLKPLNPELEQWDGYRDEISSHLRGQTGFETVLRTLALPGFLAGSARRTKKLACLQSFSPHTAEPSPDLAVYQKLCARIPGCGIEDRSMLLPAMRAIKSAAELGLMKKAAAATAAGYKAALRVLKPNVSEAAVQRALEQTYVEHGADGPAYGSIVGAGLNSTVLHYKANNQTCRAGEVLLIDSGAQYGGYACDVTRTYAISGKFNAKQQRIYDIVLKAQLAAIKAVKPGKAMWQIDQPARDIIEKADGGAYKDAYPHGIGHQLGLHVHDADPETELKPGMVITIEPGIYLAAEKIGVRIEDDVLVTARGCEVLTKAIPK